MARPRSPLAVLLGTLAFLALALAVPATRGWLLQNVWEPILVQAAPAAGLQSGYSPASLAFWALLGAALAYPAYHLVFERWRVAPDARFFLALGPLLVFGPLFHALLNAGAVPRHTFWAYLAAEPLVYLTTAALAIAGLALGRVARNPHDGLLFVGLLAVAPLLAKMVDVASGADLGRAGGTLALALVAAALVTIAARRIAPEVPLVAAFAVVAAHALDGATTWLSLRDPFGWGFEGFRESNPIALRLVEMANGWPYFAIKLALPLVLLAVMRTDRKENDTSTPRDEAAEARLRAALLFAVFVLGFGPGMSNLLQVVLG